MRARLQKLDRRDLIESALRDVEGVEANKAQWQRTIRAVLALREDKVSPKAVAMC